MPKTALSLVTFAGGEWSPKLDARVDQPKYASAQRQCQNMIPYKTGALTRRPGTKYIAACKFQNTDVRQYATRLMSFQFSPTTSFMLELGDQYIRFYSNQQQVTRSLADTAAWVGLTPYAKGAFVKDGGIIYYCILAVTSATAPAADTTHWAVQSIYEVPTPYNGWEAYGPSIFDIDIWTLTPCQINDVVYIVHPNYPPYALKRIADTNWTMQQVNFITPALLDQNATDTTIAASATTGNVNLTATAPAWAGATYYQIGDSVLQGGIIYECLVSHVSGVFATDLAAGDWVVVTIFNGGHVGSTWQLASLDNSAVMQYTGTAAGGFVNGTSGTIEVIGAWSVLTKGVWSSDIAVQQSVDNGLTWTTIRTLTSRSDANFDIDGTASVISLFRFVITNSAALVGAGATDPRVVFQKQDAFRYGLVKILTTPTAYTATATVITKLLNTNATVYWSEAAWSTYRGYPRAVTAFQQRVVYAGTTYEPQRIWGSVTNDLENMSRNTPELATDGFAFDLAAVGRGGIQWLIGQVDLFAGFSGAEWIINAGQGSFGGSNEPITPTQINAGEHSSWGSASGIPPCIAGNTVLYAQRSAQTIQQMVFSVYTNKYQSADQTVYSEHLFGEGVVQLAYQPLFRNQGIIWVTTKSGTLCGMTYQADQETFGWHRHITGINSAKFESVAVIDGQNGQDDEVWTVVNRGSRYIELMNPNNWETSGQAVKGIPTPEIKDAIYVDSATTFNNPGTLTLTGLSRFEGQQVYGLADGVCFGPLTVTGGSVTLPSSFPTTVTTVHIGLPIYYIGQTMRIDQGPRGPTQAITKAISDVYVRVFNSMGGSISNGTTQYDEWVSGHLPAYQPGEFVVSPATQRVYECLISNSGTTDPSADTTNWAITDTPSYQQPVPIPYRNNPTKPFASPQMVEAPTDIRITPQNMPSPTADPIFTVQGNDAAPLTVLALIVNYEVIGTP